MGDENAARGPIMPERFNSTSGVTPVGQQPGLQPPRGGFNSPPFEAVEALAARYEQIIHERAATWETQFDAGPGDVVSVKDAAWVIAKEVIGGH